jgi:hypothetical protein
MRAGRKKLAGRFLEVYGRSEGKRRDARKGVTFAQDGEGRTAEIVAEVSGEKADEEFTEYGGLAEPLHNQAAEGRAESDEDRGDKDRDDRIGVRDLRAGEKDAGDW